MSDVAETGGRRGRRGGGGAEARRAKRQTGDVGQFSYIRRTLKEFEVLDDEGLELIEHNAETVLAEVGIDFRDDAEALAMWKDAGADVDGERVRFPARPVPRTDQDRARPVHPACPQPERSVEIGGKNTVFVPVYGPPFVRDLDEGRRYATIEDFRNFVKLAYLAPAMHHSGGTVCEPVDVPVNKRHLDMVYSPYPLFRQAVHGLGHGAGAGRRHGRHGEARVRRRVRRPELRHDQPDQRQLADGVRRHHAGRAQGLCPGRARRPWSRRSSWPAPCRR